MQIWRILNWVCIHIIVCKWIDVFWYSESDHEIFFETIAQPSKNAIAQHSKHRQIESRPHKTEASFCRHFVNVAFRGCPKQNGSCNLTQNHRWDHFTVLDSNDYQIKNDQSFKDSFANMCIVLRNKSFIKFYSIWLFQCCNDS